jgi:Lipase (class 3).
MIVEQIQSHPDANGIFITGHSKGGGVAEAAAAVAWLEPEIPREVKERITIVTFNAAVVNARNWRVLYKETDPALLTPYLQGDAPRVDAVIMRDDLVPKVGWRNRRLRPFVNLMVIAPSERISAADQHSIAVVIAELEKRLGIYRPEEKPQEKTRRSFIYADPVRRIDKRR